MSLSDISTKPRITLMWYVGALFCLAIAASATMAYLWRHHILHQFVHARSGGLVLAVPVEPIVPPDDTSTWHRCQVGPLHFLAPRPLIENSTQEVITAQDGSQSVRFRSDRFDLAVSLPGNNEYYRRIESEYAVRFPQGDQTAMAFLADLYRTGTHEFRWSMSTHELQQHMLRMTMRRMFCRSVQFVETRLNDDVEGLLLFNSPRAAAFEWRTADGKRAGLILVDAKDGILESEWMRGLATSLSVEDLAANLDADDAGAQAGRGRNMTAETADIVVEITEP
jgi:hypothetical protein